MAERVTIERLGARADGVAHLAGHAVYVPYALPGEEVTIERDGARAQLVAIETASPDRVEPFCPYFGTCGGCAIQHLAQAPYAVWKQEIVASALRQVGLATMPEPLVDAHGEGRRRLTLHARARPGGIEVGYMAARSHHLVAIDHCPIAEPSLKRAPVIARALAQRLASSKPLDIQVTASDAGLDLDLRGLGRLNEAGRQGLVALADEHDLARVSVHGEVIVERRPPVVTTGRAGLVPPPGSFLQATRLGEEMLARLVVDACTGAKRVADLFAGSGAFSLRLAEQAEVHAVETDQAALAALDRAARTTPGLRRVTTEPRDLFRRPLLAPELADYAAAVIDPPRAGAEAQARQLAHSDVPLVVSVSCDPGTFARDAAILTASGYRLERVVPVDQFKHSPHVELVGILRREARKRRR